MRRVGRDDSLADTSDGTADAVREAECSAHEGCAQAGVRDGRAKRHDKQSVATRGKATYIFNLHW